MEEWRCGTKVENGSSGVKEQYWSSHLETESSVLENHLAALGSLRKQTTETQHGSSRVTAAIFIHTADDQASATQALLLWLSIFVENRRVWIHICYLSSCY